VDIRYGVETEEVFQGTIAEEVHGEPFPPEELF
jgi:hypothetical protein